MGKDGDRRASQKSLGSKDELKEEHARLVKKEKDLNSRLENVQGIFLQLEQAYLSSKGTFSVSRYGQLKDMIKSTTSDSTIADLHQVIQEGSASNNSGNSGLVGLLNKAKEFSGEAGEQTKHEEVAAAGKSGSKVSSFMKKLKNMTGFSEDPITDEDVMSESELQRDNARKQRSISHRLHQFSQALAKLEKLKHDYESSKAHAPPKRYQELKDMIKVAIDIKFS